MKAKLLDLAIAVAAVTAAAVLGVMTAHIH